MAANDGGVKRGNSARTGDLAANRPKDVDSAGSGISTLDDGPAGATTGDPSAGGLGSSDEYLGMDDAEGIATEGSGGIDGLTVVSADDPSLGLTNYGDKEAEDWAADTGPGRNPDRGIATDDMADDRSTLAPER